MFFVQFFVIVFLHQEIEEMISTVDKNQDGKISYSEFRVADWLIDKIINIVCENIETRWCWVPCHL